MRIYIRGNLNRLINFALAVAVLLSLTACGKLGAKSNDLSGAFANAESASRANTENNSPSATPSNNAKPELPQPITTVSTVASDIEIPGGFSIDEKSDAMFAIVLGKPEGMDEPAGVIDAYYPEEGEANYFFSIIPLRDDIQIKVENIYVHDLHFSDMVNILTNEVSAKLGEYYLVNAYVKPQPDLYMCLMVVAEDGAEQGSFLVNPVEHGESGEVVISKSKIPHGLNEIKMRSLSARLACAVWQYGDGLGWTDDAGLLEGPILSEQFALSQAFVQQAVYTVMSQMDYGNLEEPYYSEKAKQYEAVLFPGINIKNLPETDEITDRGEVVFDWPEDTEVILCAPSADGKVGYVIVRIAYQIEDRFFEDYYRVDWEADGPFDVYRPFEYKLIGVQPLMQYFLGHGEPYEHYIDRYIYSESAAKALEELGVTDPRSLYIETPGLWGSGGITLIKTKNEYAYEYADTETYILVDDDDKRLIHLGAADYTPKERKAAMPMPDDDWWEDLGIVTIPAGWSREIHAQDEIVIDGATTSNNIPMWAGWLMADSIEAELESCNYYEPFVFEDGNIGYRLFFDDYITWIRNDWMSLNLYHGGNIEVYEADKDLIDIIAMSLSAE